MSFRTRITVAATLSAGLLLVGLNAQAGTVVCDIDAPNGKNYMELSDAQVASCIDAGKGTLSGNNSGGNPDEFLSSAAGAGYGTISKSDGTNPFAISYTVDADGLSGSWSFDPSAWDYFSPDTTSLVLGFKWGTGNTFDEYFLFDLVAGVSSGTFDWFPVAVKGGGTGGLSHMILYAANTSTSTTTTTSTGSSGDVPEPGTLTLLGLSLLGLGMARRRAR